MRRIPESELIINSDGTIFHLHLKPSEIADTIILVGDPGRADLISTFFDTKEFSRASREFNTITGTYNNKRITVISTGIGCDNIDIVITELDALANVDFETRMVKEEKKSLRIMRLGTCGAVQPDIPVGSMILSHISVGCDGLLNWYADRDEISFKEMEDAFVKELNWPRQLPVPYFAKAHPEMIALFEKETVKGVTISASGFYGPQGRVVRLPLALPNMLEDFEKFRFEDWRITNFEMEGSAIAGLSAKLGHKAATMCVAIANRHLKESKPDYKEFVKKMILVALNKLCA